MSTNRFLAIFFQILIFISTIPVSAANLSQMEGGRENPNANNDSNGQIAFEGFPYRSNFLELSNGLSMHYLDEGNGEPIVLLHGNPTSSYLWRNIIPGLAERGRVIAPDLINFGVSDKTDPLTFVEHSQLITEFVETLGLKDITFVLHDWGGPIGLRYAARNSENVKAIALFEAVAFPSPFPDVDTFRAVRGGFFDAFVDPANSRTNIIDKNLFVEGLLFDPAFGSIANPPSEAEKLVYRQPFLNPEDREQILSFPQQIPVLDTTGHPIYDPDGPGGLPPEPTPNIEEFINSNEYLSTTDIPRLFVSATPGVIIPRRLVPSLQETFPGIEVKQIGSEEEPAFHYVQEDAPEEVTAALGEWIDNEVIPQKTASIPESASVFGLLALGALAISSRKF